MSRISILDIWPPRQTSATEDSLNLMEKAEVEVAIDIDNESGPSLSPGRVAAANNENENQSPNPHGMEHARDGAELKITNKDAPDTFVHHQNGETEEEIHGNAPSIADTQASDTLAENNETGKQIVTKTSKSGKTKIGTVIVTFLIGVILIIVIAMAISLTSKQRNAISNGVNSNRQPPVIADAPSSSPSPTACNYKISSNVRKLDLPLLHPSKPKVDIHGNNMVVVATDLDTDNHPVYIMFYSLVNGEWIRKQIFNEGAREPGLFSAAISGQRTLVGLTPPLTDGNSSPPPVVLEFEQNDLGVWERRGASLHLTSGDTELSVGLDNGLACAADRTGKVFVWNKLTDWWRAFPYSIIDINEGYFEGAECSVSGNTIMSRSVSGNRVSLHAFNSSPTVRVIPLQEQFGGQIIEAAVLSDDYFILSNKTDNTAHASQIFIYKQDGNGQPFIYYQSFDVTHTNSLDVLKLALVDGLFLVGVNNETRIFAMQGDGYWEEVLTLDLAFDNYRVSGRDVIGVSNNEVYSFSVEDCLPSSAPALFQSFSLTPPTSAPKTGSMTTPSNLFGSEILVVSCV